MSLRLLLLLAIATFVWAPRAHAQTVPPGYHVETLASGLANPCAFDFLPDGRVLFTEQNTGRVRLWSPTTGLQATPVLTVPGLVGGGERGLLGIAIHPRFAQRPELFVLFSAGVPARTRIARFEVSEDLGGDLVADPASLMDLVPGIPDAAPNHNGGTLRFAADGRLIASLGDDAVPCAAQDTLGLRGVLLRMSIDRLSPGPGVASIGLMTPFDNPYATSSDSSARLVLAYGLRNPFRVQCDPALPWVIIGDVGESLREELDLLALPSAITTLPGMVATGANFGWPYREGTTTGVHANDCAPTPDGLAAPVYDYDRTQQNGASIIPAGFMPELITLAVQPGLPAGLYFSDYYSGALVRLASSGNAWQVAPPVAGQANAARFGEGFREISDWRVRDRSLWYVRQAVNFGANTGSIGRVVADSLPGPDPRPIGALTATLDRVPAVAQATIRISDAFRYPARLTIHDGSGRTRRRIESFGLNAGQYFAFWDGLDDDGEKVPAGLYWARLESAGRTVTVRVPFLR